MVDIKTCLRCGHLWTSRSENPIACPSCKSYQWKLKIKNDKRKK
jgi:rubrerythrin